MRLPAVVCEGEAWWVVPLNVVGRDQSASCSALTGGGFSAAPGESRFRTAVAGLVVGLRFTPLGARCRSRLIVAVMPIVAFQGILGLQDLVRRPGAGSCRSPCRSRVDTSFYDIGGSHRSGVLAPGLAEDAARVSPFEPWGLSRSDKPRVVELLAVVGSRVSKASAWPEFRSGSLGYRFLWVSLPGAGLESLTLGPYRLFCRTHRIGPDLATAKPGVSRVAEGHRCPGPRLMR